MTIYNPRGIPLTLAERRVDYLAHNRHIVERRSRVETAARPVARKIALARLEVGFVPSARRDELTDRLAAALSTTVRFGHAQARKEILSSRKVRPVLAYEVPDAGEYARVSRYGLAAVLELIRSRARDAAAAVVLAAEYATVSVEEAETPGGALAAVLLAARKRLHLNVLELVGEALNLGRSAGAFSLPYPPEFALRSEVLDRNTCDQCSRLHGEIAQVDSPGYWNLMPPTGCFGGGRCRGIMVYGDAYGDVSQREAA